jgi:cell wall-associated NlpC family hydrolase
VAVPGSPAPSGSVAPAADAYAISSTALALRGTPYRNGGSDPSGFDCSGFVWYVFARHGVPVPRTVSDLYRAGVHVDAADLRAGDLVFFDTLREPQGGALRGPQGGPSNTQAATHVGISIGGDEFVHAPSGAGQVRVERLASTYWAPRFLEARRLSGGP